MCAAFAEDQGSVKSEDSLTGRAKFLCSYGGRIMPRPHDSQLRYVGGETRILSVQRNVSLLDLLAKLRKICPFESLILKYQLPNEDLDALVSVISEEDLENMMEEYDRMESKDSSSRLRLFLFPVSVKPTPSQDNSIDLEQKFVEAVNGVYRKANVVPETLVVDDQHKKPVVFLDKSRIAAHQSPALGATPGLPLQITATPTLTPQLQSQVPQGLSAMVAPPMVAPPIVPSPNPSAMVAAAPPASAPVPSLAVQASSPIPASILAPTPLPTVVPAPAGVPAPPLIAAPVATPVAAPVASPILSNVTPPVVTPHVATPQVLPPPVVTPHVVTPQVLRPSVPVNFVTVPSMVPSKTLAANATPPRVAVPYAQTAASMVPQVLAARPVVPQVVASSRAVPASTYVPLVDVSRGVLPKGMVIRQYSVEDGLSDSVSSQNSSQVTDSSVLNLDRRDSGGEVVDERQERRVVDNALATDFDKLKLADRPQENVILQLDANHHHKVSGLATHRHVVLAARDQNDPGQVTIVRPQASTFQAPATTAYHHHQLYVPGSEALHRKLHEQQQGPSTVTIPRATSSPALQQSIDVPMAAAATAHHPLMHRQFSDRSEPQHLNHQQENFRALVGAPEVMVQFDERFPLLHPGNGLKHLQQGISSEAAAAIQVDVAPHHLVQKPIKVLPQVVATNPFQVP